MQEGLGSIVERVGDRPQTTILNTVECSGIALFSGRIVRFRLRPAPANTGIVFRRMDLPNKPVFSATASNVIATPRCTIVGNLEASVQLVEHLLSAVFGFGIDNLLVEIDGPEMPIFDGSSLEFVRLLDNAGRINLHEVKPQYKLTSEVKIEMGDSVIRAVPSKETKFRYKLSYDEAGLLGLQEHEVGYSLKEYKETIAASRTFSRYEEIGPLLESGKIKGGSLESAVVIKDGKVVNPEGLRFPNEMARHKILDMMGDLCLASYDIIACYEGVRSGHTQTTRLSKKLEQIIAGDTSECQARQVN